VRRPKDYLLLYFKGVGVGVGSIIPGVSGGTIAFLTNVYEELIVTLRAIDRTSFRLFFTLQLSTFWEKINGNFLVCILAGIVTSVLTLFNVINYVHTNYPISVSSFFFGMIIVSTPLVLREIKKWEFVTILLFTVGLASAYLITVIPFAETPNTLYFIFLCGAVTVSATMLPGVSGVFMLLLLGKYEFLIMSITNFDIAVIAAFLLGWLIGLAGFSRLLAFMLLNFRFPTLALLAGIMIGSLNKLWPWKIITGFRFDLEGIQMPAFEKSVWPGQFDKDPHLFHAILFAALGIFLVVAIEKIAAFIKSKN